MSRDHGGSTSYYDIPCNEVLLGNILKEYINFILDSGLSKEDFTSHNLENFVEDVQEAFPKTLSDLIDHKNMSPNLHEVFKATYALEERAKLKNKGDKVRELNKIIFYAQREKDKLTKDGFLATKLENSNV